MLIKKNTLGYPRHHHLLFLNINPQRMRQYEGRSIIFVTWHRNFTYTCIWLYRSKSRKHIRKKSIPKAYTLWLYSICFGKGSKWHQFHRTNMSSSLHYTSGKRRLTATQIHQHLVGGIECAPSLRTIQRLSFSVVRNRSGTSSIQASEWHPWLGPILTRFINS